MASRLSIGACAAPTDGYNASVAKRKPDRHLTPKMTLRLPSAAGDALRTMAVTEDRTITAIVMRALRLYAGENGYEWPKTAPPPDAAGE